jgi:spermidine synthase
LPSPIFGIGPAEDWEDGGVSSIRSHRLKFSGLLAEIEPDPWREGGWVLTVDGTPQSHVDLSHPSELHFEYIARMGHIIDEAFEPGEALTAVHLGAGALTIPRYVAVTHPGSRQQVIEIETDLIDFVREHLPLPRDASIRCRYGDARAVMGSLPGGILGQVDLVVVDIFRGARTPAHVTSVEFYTEVQRLLSPRGIVVINVADGPPLAFAKSQLATVRHVFGDGFAIAESSVAKGRRFGNVVLAAWNGDREFAGIPRLMAAGPHPSKVIAGSEAAEWVRSAPIVTDATAIDSPPPSRNLFAN